MAMAIVELEMGSSMEEEGRDEDEGGRAAAGEEDAPTVGAELGLAVGRSWGWRGVELKRTVGEKHGQSSEQDDRSP